MGYVHGVIVANEVVEEHKFCGRVTADNVGKCVRASKYTRQRERAPTKIELAARGAMQRTAGAKRRENRRKTLRSPVTSRTKCAIGARANSPEVSTSA